MIDKLTCPFCGSSVHKFENKAEAEHPLHPVECPLSKGVLEIDQWNMRPPRKEQPAAPVIESEVAWLRSIVRDVIAMKVVNVTLPNGVNVSEGKE